jgi:hypothetical protein
LNPAGRHTNNKRTTWKYVKKFKERKQHIKQMKTSQNKEPRSKTERRDNKTNIKLPEVACKITLRWSWVGLSAPPKAFYWRCFKKKRPLKSHPIFSQKILDRTPIWIWRSMVVYCKSCCSHLRSAVLPQMKRNWTEWFRMEPLCYFVCFSLQNWHNHSRNWVISHPLLSSPGFLTGNGKGVAIYNFNVFYLFQTMHKIILPNSSICPRHF